MKIEINPSVIFNRLIISFLILLFANCLGIAIRSFSENQLVIDITYLFDFDYERNIPTLFSSILLLIASALMWFISWECRYKASHYKHWMGLSFVFLFMTVDEFASLHEELIPVFRSLFNTTGFLHFAWV
ncbi:hypothetical protein E1176_10170 [Fulvivirga sp. RKSG066]|uniref:hypothetical protein n=1 Tax=Fulvivirga aurantia TaxID=2529383 RepID=UPI0012BBF074|nr:hypothetical protein [Fulvivirga aurantia]MTI21385.1 hypothetical protein [Fulvivirga aurantia]